jgi:cytochrome c-type biogenesis protein CcmH/NrfF
LVSGPPPSPAQQQQASDLAHDLPSPYCPGRSIASCPSGAARDLEGDILAQLQSGATPQQVEQTLVARFGREKMGHEANTEVILAVTLLAIAAVVAIAMLARRWSRGARADVSESEASDPLGGVSQRELDELEGDLDDVETF